MNIPEQEDLKIQQGSSFFIDWQWLEGDEDIPSSLEPVDLSRFVAYLQIKSSFDSETVLCGIDSVTAHEITFESDEGIIHVRIPPEKTFKLPWKRPLFYDLKLINLDTMDAYRVKEGMVSVRPEITKIKSPIVC